MLESRHSFFNQKIQLWHTLKNIYVIYTIFLFYFQFYQFYIKQEKKKKDFWEVWNDEKEDALMADCILTDKLLLLVYCCNKTRSHKALLSNARKTEAK